VKLGPEEMPGYRGPRVTCDVCGEGINFAREVRRGDQVLCRACSGERYYDVLS
jgi:formylmethanofuran dehydrogenase subunit E